MSNIEEKAKDFIAEIADVCEHYEMTLACEEGIFYIIPRVDKAWLSRLERASVDE